MCTRTGWFVLVCVVLADLIWSAGISFLPLDRNARADDKPDATPEAHKADIAAITAQAERFRKAFAKGNAQEVASFWTPNGELIESDGDTYRGRAALEKAYRTLFGDKEKRDVEMERESIRFPSQDTAIEEGTFKVHTGKAEPKASRYSILHVREGGNWLMAVVRESAAETVSLQNLDWLIGTWSAKQDDTAIDTTYEWLWNKSYIRVQFSIRQKGRTLSGLQMIGVDPTSGELHTWTFESEGGVGEATWSRDGKVWVLDSVGHLTDGSTLAAKLLLTPIDKDSFTWQAVDRSVDGEEAEDLPPLKVTRVNPKR
jgi:uncharacterized protein (TIGR02246 family)